jgi:hypothetical protein
LHFSAELLGDVTGLVAATDYPRGDQYQQFSTVVFAQVLTEQVAQYRDPAQAWNAAIAAGLVILNI